MNMRSLLKVHNRFEDAFRIPGALSDVVGVSESGGSVPAEAPTDDSGLYPTDDSGNIPVHD